MHLKLDKQGRQPVPAARAALLAAAVLAGCGGGGSDDAQAAGGLDAVVASRDEAACTAVGKLTGVANAPTITSAKWTPAGTAKASASATTFLPAHCTVQGSMAPHVGVDGVQYAIKFELRLPQNWNGRFFFQGGGGLEGTLPAAYGSTGGARTALEQGFAVVSQNGGHDNALLSSSQAFGLDPQARIDFGYGSVEKTARTAKSLLKTYYAHEVDKSYFDGCSTGGRQGMSFAQRFPELFDGIVAGAPVFDYARHIAGQIWSLQHVAAIVPAGSDGKPQYYKAMSTSDKQLFQKALLAACDAQDGATDGMVSDFMACNFKPETLQCSGEKNDSCLSSQQVGLLKAVMSGPLKSDGQPFKVPGYTTNAEFAVPGYRVDPGWMASSGQSTRLFGTETALPGDFGLGVYPTPYLHMTPPQPAFDPITQVNWDNWNTMMTINAPWLMADPDISAFRDRKGKILFYHGTGDPGPNIMNTLNYYNEVVARNGGMAQTQTFARLFMVPAMGHCGSGPATDSFDRLQPMVDWVEKGTAPASILASARSGNADLNAVTPAIPATRTRPLCPYPQHAHYKGTGSVDDAANFACQ